MILYIFFSVAQQLKTELKKKRGFGRICFDLEPSLESVKNNPLHRRDVSLVRYIFM